MINDITKYSLLSTLCIFLLFIFFYIDNIQEIYDNYINNNNDYNNNNNNFLKKTKIELTFTNNNNKQFNYIELKDNIDEIDKLPIVENENEIEYKSLAPRTYDGEYNEFDKNKKYFLYTPSGGFNNQREEMEVALEIGNILNRTVYIPMAGKHTSLWKMYYQLNGQQNLFPMDRLIDFKELETYKHVNVVPLNISVRNFVYKITKKHGKKVIREEYHRVRKSWHRQDLIKFKKLQKPIFYLKGAEMYHRWFPTNLMVKLKTHVKYNRYIRELAIKIAKKHFGEKMIFNSMHIRLGDYADRTPSAGYFIKLLRFRKNAKFEPLYIATEPHHTKQYFKPLLKLYNVTFSQDLPKILLKEYKDIFPQGQIRSDMLGLLEQLLCVISKKFVGTPFSTFSSYINYMRNMKGFVYPEVATQEELDRVINYGKKRKEEILNL